MWQRHVEIFGLVTLVQRTHGTATFDFRASGDPDGADVRGEVTLAALDGDGAPGHEDNGDGEDEDTAGAHAGTLPTMSRAPASPAAGRTVVATMAGVKALRRALLALGLAGLVAGAIRLRGSGGVPPQHGGWRELSGPDLR